MRRLLNPLQQSGIKDCLAEYIYFEKLITPPDDSLKLENISLYESDARKSPLIIESFSGAKEGLSLLDFLMCKSFHKGAASTQDYIFKK